MLLSLVARPFHHHLVVAAVPHSGTPASPGDLDDHAIAGAGPASQSARFDEGQEC
jgi:hypothetical protein